MLVWKTWNLKDLLKLISQFCEWKLINKIYTKFEFAIFFFMIKIELYSSKPGSLVIEDPSIDVDGLNEKISLGWVSLNSNVSCGFLWVCFTTILQLLVNESNKSSVSFSGRIKSYYL